MTADQVKMFDPLVKACVRRFTPSSLPASIDVDDLEQTVWQAAILAIRSYDPKMNDSLEAWVWLKMRGALLNEVERHRFGKSRNRTEPIQEPSPLGAHSEVTPGTEETAEAAARFAEVMQAVKDLPARQRRVLVARLDGLGIDEIAAELGVHRSRVSQLNSEARKRISGQVAA